MIKLVITEGSELEIARFLMSESARQDENNTIIPILETLVIDERWTFIVMPRYPIKTLLTNYVCLTVFPRWSCVSSLQRWGFNHVGQAMDFTMSMLKVWACF